MAFFLFPEILFFNQKGRTPTPTHIDGYTPLCTCMCAYTLISYLFHCRQTNRTISAFTHFFILHRCIENPDIGLRFRDIFGEKFYKEHNSDQIFHWLAKEILKYRIVMYCHVILLSMLDHRYKGVLIKS